MNESDLKRRARVFLRVRSKELAEEARFIRLEEKRAKARRKTHLLNELAEHRKMVVRPQARLTHLTLAYIRGMPYGVVEQPDSRPFDKKALVKMVGRFLKLDLAWDRDTPLRMENLSTAVDRWLETEDKTK